MEETGSMKKSGLAFFLIMSLMQNSFFCFMPWELSNRLQIRDSIINDIFLYSFLGIELYSLVILIVYKRSKHFRFILYLEIIYPSMTFYASITSFWSYYLIVNKIIGLKSMFFIIMPIIGFISLNMYLHYKFNNKNVENEDSMNKGHFALIGSLTISGSAILKLVLSGRSAKTNTYFFCAVTLFLAYAFGVVSIIAMRNFWDIYKYKKDMISRLRKS